MQRSKTEGEGEGEGEGDLFHVSLSFSRQTQLDSQRTENTPNSAGQHCI